MPRDKTASHELVMKARREEFTQYGFKDASMRRIGERAGMTAAGLYRHFRNKEDMFEELVRPAIDDINGWLESHRKRSYLSMENGGEGIWSDSEIDMMRDLIYPRKEEYSLLLNCAKGSRHENFLHDMVTEQQKHMMEALAHLENMGYPVHPISEKGLHLLLTAYTSALFEPVIHDYTYEEALRCLEAVESFFLPGWEALIGLSR
ncbi:MAG: TetR/AcrR family transcriptional regulator [Oscillospiraceae bacterium]|nr:TetR/AcrR family transcriptional regulator [Oscillospiraceae bacterium]